MNCFLNEVRGYVDLDEGGRNTDFALWQYTKYRIYRIQNFSCEDMDGECQQMECCILAQSTVSVSPHVDKCLDMRTPQSNTLL